MPSSEEYTKTLGIQWNAHKDHFKLTISSPPPFVSITKRGFVSDVAKTFRMVFSIDYGQNPDATTVGV